MELELAIAELESRYDEDSALASFAAMAVHFPDSLVARTGAARLALAADDPERIKSELARLIGKRGALGFLHEGAWRCTSCQRRFSEFFWRCQACRHWGTASADTGEPVVVKDRRDRRQRARTGDGELVLSTGLPEPALDAGDERADGEGASVVSRARSWFTDAWGSLRNRD